MSLTASSNTLKNKPRLKGEITEIYNFLAEQQLGDFETASRINDFTGIEMEVIDAVLDLLEKENLLKRSTRQLCGDCDCDLDLHPMSKYWCDGCDKYKKSEKVMDVQGFEIVGIFQRQDDAALVNIPALSEFQQDVIKSVAKYILNARRKNPTWLQEVKTGARNVREDFYRDDIEAAFKVAYRANGEINHTKGRSDLIVNPIDQSLDAVIGEFKVWGSNDYLSVCGQLMGYMDNYENVGFVFMINENKSSIWERYIAEVIECDEHYVKDSIEKNPVAPELKDFIHYSSVHQVGERGIKIFHFIFDNKF